MPGYRVENERVLVNFGSYADIHDSFTPPENCPHPENERLANYLMRLFAMCDNADLCLVQRDDSTLKGDLQNIADKLDNLDPVDLSGIQEAIEGISTGVSEFNLAFSLKLDSIIEKFVLIQADVSGLKIQIDKLYAENLHVAIEGGLEGLEGIDDALNEISEKIGKGLLRPPLPEEGEEDMALLGDVVGELEIFNDQENILQIGNDSIYLKSNVVHSK